MHPFARLPAILAAVAFGFLASVAAAALPPGVTQGASVEGITEYSLKNGLKVLLFPDASRPKTTVNVTYLVGSRHENYGETGMAHLLEHMLFKGTPTHRQLDAEFSRRGIQSNANTFYDRTSYHDTFNASTPDLDWVLALEADRMTHSIIAKKDLDSEMTVVRNEMEQGENSPSSILTQKLLATAYEWHSYGKETIGARSDVELVDIGRLQTFYRMYYQPDNAVLVVAGAFDRDRTLALIARYFGPIPRPARTLPRLYTVEPVQDGERTVTLRRVGNTQFLAVAYHTVPGAHADSVALDALADLMTVAPAGRLYQALIETKKATAVDNWNAALHDPSFVMFEAQVPVTDSLADARTALLATLEGVRSRPITAAEVERVRAKSLKHWDETFADVNRLGLQLTEAIAAGDWRLFFLQRDRWRAVTVADVQRVAETWLKPSNRTLGEFIPDPNPDRAPVAPTVDVAALVKDYRGDPAMSAGESLDPTPANLEARTIRFTLGNGMKIVLLPKRTRGSTVRFALHLHQGDEKSLFGQAPRGTLAAAMLPRGTLTKSRQEIEDALDQARAKLSVGGGETATVAGGQTVRATLGDTLRLVAEILRQPAFPAEEFETIRRERIAALEESRDDPDSLAERALERHGNPYPAGDVRYVPTLDEEIAGLRAATPDDARRFYAQFVGGAHAELALVGDFDAAEVRALVTELFGNWSSPAPFTRVPDPLVRRPPAAIALATPDKASASAQGEIAFALNDTGPDYPAMVVATYILGGVDNSRLWKRVRDKEGLSYGVYAMLHPGSFEPNSTLRIGAQFAPGNLARTKAAIGEEVTRAVRDGFTPAEVAEAKAGVLKLRRLGRTQDGSLAGALAQQAYLGRTFALSGRIDAAIAALTPAAVNAALSRYVQPDAFAFVYAGDFAKTAK
ncbi:MAG: pitrilysin family protein [Betaproteobacteria bacterium]